MNDPIKTFWSGSINPASFSEPKNILRTQAASLGNITKNIVEATINSTIETDEEVDGFISEPKIIHSFDIVAPLLGYQKFTLFYIKQTIGIEYPVEIHSKYIRPVKYSKCNNLQEFESSLKEILSSDIVVKLINSIIGQSL